MSLTGPSRTIVVEPLERPQRAPEPERPRPAPAAPREAPHEPGPDREPART